MQRLLTLPRNMVEAFASLPGKSLPDWFACSDPPGPPLGSGGGTVHALVRAWRATAPSLPLEAWLRQGPKLVIHAGGQSRRLPAYAPTGKALIPIPVFRWTRGQRLDQTLLDLQLPLYEHVLAHAVPRSLTLIASGDVLVQFGQSLPAFPAVDVLGLGMPAPAELAKDFGVFFSPRQRPTELTFFLQKPPSARICELAQDYLALLDTGMWLLSERALQVLFKRCGWEPSKQAFMSGAVSPFELYSQLGLALGTNPTVPDPEMNALTSAVAALPQAIFFDFGTSRLLVDSVSAIQNLKLDGSEPGLGGGRGRSDQIVQNARFGASLNRDENANIWVENSFVPAGWKLASNHVITGAPENDWSLTLPAGVCLDFAPVGPSGWCIRAYGIEDRFAGQLRDPATSWFGQPIRTWFENRGLRLEECKLDPENDIQCAPLFPLLLSSQLEPGFIQWLVEPIPQRNDAFERLWQELPRLSASELALRTNLTRLFGQRRRLLEDSVSAMRQNFRRSVFFQTDLESSAQIYAGTAHALTEMPVALPDEPMRAVRERMFRSAVLRHRNDPGWREAEAQAFAALREWIAGQTQLAPADPRRNILEDQVVWGRSPARLDLAGGWSDTPPYCLEHGGAVLNLAADLNGQPPIQVFAKLGGRPELVLRSIDLGVEERVQSYEQLACFNRPEDPFALARAALALAGFHPRFHRGAAFSSLQEQFLDFGGGLELSLLSAVPKGSGLGTSSILAATVLATVADVCGLNWDRDMLLGRTLALEQLLTTGGGWQDQAGAIYRGIKLIRSTPGLPQRPVPEWLPSHLFGPEYANRSVLLYYTGMTRMAKNILAEIVRSLFLNCRTCLETIDEIRANAGRAAAAIQACEYAALLPAIRASWELNQRLDRGTNPPPVQRILDLVQDYLGAAKLLGAGGGGYLLLLAKDEDAAVRIKKALKDSPPNNRARFVNFSLSDTGLQVTRS